MLADVLPGYAIYCSAGRATASAGGRIRGRPSAARAPRRRCSPAAWRSSTSCCAQRPRRTSGWSTRSCTRSAEPGAAGVFDDVTVGDNDVGPHSTGKPARVLHSRPRIRRRVRLGQRQHRELLRVRAPARSRRRACVAVAAGTSAPAIESRAEGDGRLLCRLHCRRLRVDQGWRCEPVRGGLEDCPAADPPGTLRCRSNSARARCRRSSAGKRHHKRITATIYGVALDSTVYGVIGVPGESVQAQTGGNKLTLQRLLGRLAIVVQPRPKACTA